jgi:hypothetical protein
MKRFFSAILILTTAFLWTVPVAAQQARPLRVLLTFGGHGFQEEPFFAMFDALDNVEYTKAPLPEKADLLKPGLEKQYDVIVMYDMVAGFTPEQQQAFVALLNEGNRRRVAAPQPGRAPRLGRIPEDHRRQVHLRTHDVGRQDLRNPPGRTAKT